MELIWHKTRFAWIAQIPSIPNESQEVQVVEINLTFQELCCHLLELGGKSVCVPFTEKDCLKLLSHARIFSTEGMMLKIGEPNACHANSAWLWKKNPAKYHIVTGYALTDDDWMWRQHSWVIDNSERIIETISPRFTYYGVVFNFIEALMFTKVN